MTFHLYSQGVANILSPRSRVQSCQVELVEFLESLQSVISRSRRDSVGGGGAGCSRIFPCSPTADAIQWGGGGSSRIFPSSPTADAIQWGGGIFPCSPDADARFGGGGGGWG